PGDDDEDGVERRLEELPPAHEATLPSPLEPPAYDRPMVTADEIAEVAIFAALGAAERERLSRAAADISLLAGEYAAHEGGERALFGLLEGRIEAVKLVDGIERVGGEGRPGDGFGAVPSRLGAAFPVGFRAAALPRVR